MRKLFTAAILFVIMLSSLNGQVKIGLMGGMNFSDANQNQFYFSNAGHTVKLALGAICDIPLTKNLSLYFEPHYVEKGTNQGPFSIFNIMPHISFDLSYLEIPILFKYSVGGNLKPYIFAGPSIGFNLSSNLSAKIAGIDFSIGTDDIMTPLEYSFNLGGGINYKVDDILSVFVEARYEFGLNDILDKNEIRLDFAGSSENFFIPSGTRYHNKGILLMFGFSFPLIID